MQQNFRTIQPLFCPDLNFQVFILTAPKRQAREPILAIQNLAGGCHSDIRIISKCLYLPEWLRVITYNFSSASVNQAGVHPGAPFF
jgi:hypothetical protein